MFSRVQSPGGPELPQVCVDAASGHLFIQHGPICHCPGSHEGAAESETLIIDTPYSVPRQKVQQVERTHAKGRQRHERDTQCHSVATQKVRQFERTRAKVQQRACSIRTK